MRELLAASSYVMAVAFVRHGLAERTCGGLRQQRKASIHWGFGTRDGRTERQQRPKTLSNPGCFAICICILGADGSLRRISTLCERRYFRAGRVAAES